MQVLAAAADGDDDGDAGGDPGEALVHVQGGVAAEGDDEGQDGHDDDSDADGEVAVGDGRETLSARDDDDDGEAGGGGQVEEDREGDDVAA